MSRPFGTVSRPAPRRSALALLAALVAAPAAAEQVTDPVRDYAPNDAQVTTTWFDVLVLPRGADSTAAARVAREADRRYIAGMRPHHAGALTMAEEYLADPNASSPVLRRLAHAIIPNQAYEIALLDDVARRIEEPPRVVDLGVVRLALRPAGTENLGQAWRFQRAPLPGLVEAFATAPVTERDVKFAKGMTIHHQAALDMARAYNADPNARNGVRKWLNVGIITDQSQEIAMMRQAIAAYPGDAAAVRVDPASIHGMEGHAGHGAAPQRQEPIAAPRRPPAAVPRRASQPSVQPHAGHH